MMKVSMCVWAIPWKPWRYPGNPRDILGILQNCPKVDTVGSDTKASLKPHFIDFEPRPILTWDVQPGSKSIQWGLRLFVLSDPLYRL